MCTYLPAAIDIVAGHMEKGEVCQVKTTPLFAYGDTGRYSKCACTVGMVFSYGTVCTSLPMYIYTYTYTCTHVHVVLLLTVHTSTYLLNLLILNTLHLYTLFSMY